MKVPDTLTANDIGAGWGANTETKAAPTVSEDEDFGGWASAAPASATAAVSSFQSNSSTAGVAKPMASFGGADDLFSNVWQ